MSRFVEYDDDGDERPAHWWEQRVERDFRSGRGQRNIQRLIDALDVMPRKELTEGFFADVTHDDQDHPIGHVCVLGALATQEEMKAGISWDEAADLLPSFEGDGESTAHYARQHLGMSEALAWRIAQVNDDDLGDCPREERWVRMRAWLVSQLSIPDPWRRALRMAVA